MKLQKSPPGSRRRSSTTRKIFGLPTAVRERQHVRRPVRNAVVLRLVESDRQTSTAEPGAAPVPADGQTDDGLRALSAASDGSTKIGSLRAKSAASRAIQTQE
jgi:hypothetical protein